MIALREQLLGSSHFSLTFPLRGVALIAEQQNEYEEAHKMLEKCLHIREEQLGKDHVLVAEILRDMVRVGRKYGAYQQLM